MAYRVTYARRAELQRDLDSQLTRGGLFVKVRPPAGLLHATRLSLQIITPDAPPIEVVGEVLAAVDDQGLAISVGLEVCDAVRAALAMWRPDRADGGEARHELVSDAVGEGAVARKTEVGWDECSPAEKMHRAQHGDRDDRAAALRDKNRAIHPHVLRNPRMSVEEVLALSRNPQIAGDLLKLVADRTDWMGRAQIAEAIARNPKAPNDIAVRALANVSSEALRQIAKGVGAPPHVVAAARKRLLG